MVTTHGDLNAPVDPGPAGGPPGLHRGTTLSRRAPVQDVTDAAHASDASLSDLARPRHRRPGRRAAGARSDIPKPTPHVRVGWRPVEVAYARRWLGPGHVVGFDPHCTRCGHRALSHGLAGLSAEAQGRRWFTPEAVTCQWHGCGCEDWSPARGVQSPVEALGEAYVPETWVEVPLGGAWVVAYRLVNDRGKPVVGELRVLPAEGDRPGPGQWSGEVLGTLAPVPPGGITGRLLRGLRVRAYLRGIDALVRRLRDQHAEFARVVGWRGALPAAVKPPPAGHPGRRGRKGRPDRFYAEVAADYVRGIGRGSSRPIKDVARRRRRPPTQVRDWIREARKRGLLTSVEPGVSGGGLTDRAEALLPTRHQARPPGVEDRKSARQRRRPMRVGGGLAERGRRELPSRVRSGTPPGSRHTVPRSARDPSGSDRARGETGRARRDRRGRSGGR